MTMIPRITYTRTTEDGEQKFLAYHIRHSETDDYFLASLAYPGTKYVSFVKITDGFSPVQMVDIRSNHTNFLKMYRDQLPDVRVEVLVSGELQPTGTGWIFHCPSSPAGVIRIEYYRDTGKTTVVCDVDITEDGESQGWVEDIGDAIREYDIREQNYRHQESVFSM